MSSRFHNKYHRHNHHTLARTDPRYPDASHDPIASPESPFYGDFVMRGCLFTTSDLFSTELTGKPAGNFEGYAFGIRSIAKQAGGVALSAVGDVNITGSLSANNITFTGQIIQTFNDPVTATGDFLIVNVNGSEKAIRLWNFS
jgi:hypothetical protein